MYFTSSLSFQMEHLRHRVNIIISEKFIFNLFVSKKKKRTNNRQLDTIQREFCEWKVSLQIKDRGN